MAHRPRWPVVITSGRLSGPQQQRVTHRLADVSRACSWRCEPPAPARQRLPVPVLPRTRPVSVLQGRRWWPVGPGSLASVVTAAQGHGGQGLKTATQAAQRPK